MLTPADFPGLVVDRIDSPPHRPATVHATPVYQPARECPKCGCARFVTAAPVTLRDIVRGLPVRLVVAARRYWCWPCHSGEADPIPWRSERHPTLTVGAVLIIADHLRQGETPAQIIKRYGRVNFPGPSTINEIRIAHGIPPSKRGRKAKA